MLQSIMVSYQNGKFGWIKLIAVFAISLVAIVIVRQVMTANEAENDSNHLRLSRKIITAATWNIAAINNNPFEYWITNNDTNYMKLMTSVSEFVDHPTPQQDIQVDQLLNNTMVNELFQLFKDLKWHGWNETMTYWRTDYSHRKIISGFLKDDLIGKKRLTSMPDRMTNTINSAVEGVMYYRPTVINCYGKTFPTLKDWWKQWKDFMFKSKIQVKKGAAVTTIHPYQLLAPISRAKYPSISVQEASASLPLQTLCLAIFDGILVHMMNSIGEKVWQPIRSTLCTELNHKKNSRTLGILTNKYSDMDIIFLQEVAANFAQVARKHPLGVIYEVHQPQDFDQDRDQNSFILLKKGRYDLVHEVTKEVMALMPNSTKVPVAKGDLFVILAVDKLDSAPYIFASFHGDTNGLATKPVVAAVQAYAITQQPKSKLIFGLDANTYSTPEKDQQGVTDFAQFYVSKKLNSCYGPTPNPLNFTTFNARTHLQPQLNKAVSFANKDKLGDKNPKDFILFFESDYKVVDVGKDNTGEKKYVENMVFPTLSFPSDHGITYSVLEENEVKRR